VNNGRFLVLLWVRVNGLASKILAQSARQLPTDWDRRYGYRPLLLETLVKRNDSGGLVIEQPTGSGWGKRKDAEGWMVNTEPRA
jgi:hypothetical protein